MRDFGILDELFRGDIVCNFGHGDDAPLSIPCVSSVEVLLGVIYVNMFPDVVLPPLTGGMDGGKL